MKLIFGLNIILEVEVIDDKVGYSQTLYFNVHNIRVGDHSLPSGLQVLIFCDYHGKRIYFNSFDDVARLNKRKLLALRRLTVVLS